MSKTIVLKIFCSVILFLSTQNILSQEKANIMDNLNIPDSSHVQILTTHGGSTNIGRIVEIRENEIIFDSGIGLLTVPISKIKAIKEVSVDSIKNGQYWFINPNATRLYFAPTAQMLKKGKGYISDHYIFFPGFAYGVTDKFTIGGGFSLFPGVGIDKQLFFLTPKVGLRATENFNLALGTLLIKLPDFADEDTSSDDDDSKLVGILYGVSTFGKPDGCVTIGLGYGFEGGDLAKKPMITIGGEKRLSRRISFVTENWIFPGLDDPLISYGVRFLGEKLSIDLALVNIIGEDMIFPGIPYIDFVFAF